MAATSTFAEEAWGRRDLHDGIIVSDENNLAPKCSFSVQCAYGEYIRTLLSPTALQVTRSDVEFGSSADNSVSLTVLLSFMMLKTLGSSI